ncbi:DmpA/ArgJ-like protein [Thozetella sp. PMI_491]|nr:DmpA/ArgJ-like protein [Thozetella sp. PMI_491]
MASPRARLRDIVPNIYLGQWPPGPKNSLTDVPGVLASTKEIISREGKTNTGVTVLLPRQDWFHQACYAGIFRFNGSGEMTGSHWIEETGLLASPIIITNSFAVGAAYQGIYKYAIEKYDEPEDGIGWFLLPVVAETFDGHLNDMSHFAVEPDHIVEGIKNATSDRVPEGNRGGGTGMICQGFKGGTGSSSRLVPSGKGEDQKYTLGAIVQANYGRLNALRFSGIPVGRIIAQEREAEKLGASEADKAKDKKDGSIIVIIATDAPLHPLQCQRLAKRATVGLSRVGGYGHNPSGDIFLAFSTGNEIPVQTYTGTKKSLDPFKATPLNVEVVDDQTINALFEAAADATEEAIYNALCMAETITGFHGHTIEALPLDKLKEIVEKYQ